MTEYEKAMMELKNAFGSESMWNVPLPALMSPEEEAAYRANNFVKQDEIRKRIEEEEAAKRAAQSGSGLFGSMPSDGLNDGVQGRNPYQEMEDRFYQENLTKGMTPENAKTLAGQQAFEIQSANNARINSALTLFGNAMIPGMGALGLSKYGPEGYMDYLQGNTRVMMGDTSGYDKGYIGKAAGIAAPVVSGQRNYNTYSPSAQIARDMARDILAREADNRAMSEISRTYGGFNTRGDGNYLTSYGPTYSTSGMSPETTAGLEAAQASFGYGTDADYFGD